jgi:hypothetical protein
MDSVESALAALPLVEELGRTRFEQIFGGATRSPTPGVLRVYLTASSPDLEKAMAAVFDGPIDFQITHRTEVERERLHAQVTAEREHLAQAGIELIRWSSDVETGNERIGVLKLTEEKRAVLLDTFGPWLELYNLDDYGQLFGGSTS